MSVERRETKDRRDEFNGKIRSFGKRATIENHEGWLAIDGSWRFRQFFEVREIASSTQHAQLFVAVQRARIFFLRDDNEPEFIARTQSRERLRSMSELRRENPIGRNRQCKLRGPIRINKSVQGFVHLSGTSRTRRGR